MSGATWEACGRAAAPSALMGQGQPGPRSSSRSFQVRHRSGNQGQLHSSHECLTCRRRCSWARQHPRTLFWQDLCTPCPWRSGKHQ